MAGADVSLLSQFNNEREVLFPPLTMLRAIPKDLRGESPPPDPRMRQQNIMRARLLEKVPGEKARRDKLLSLLRAVADAMLHARDVMERSKAMLQVTPEKTESGHDYVRVCVQPSFTGMTTGDDDE